MGKRAFGPILVLTLALAGFSVTASAAEPAPGTSLSLPNATDADLAALKDRQDLRMLDLSHSGVTDAGLANLKDLKNLETLNLNGSLVSNAGLADLKGLKNLKRLDLQTTYVTRAGLADLKAALPNTKIFR